MRRVLIATALAMAASCAAYAQNPAPKPDANAAHPPENRMEQATPTLKAPEGQLQTAPTGRVGEAVPPMKSTDPQSADTGTKAANIVANEQWIGRSVYSSDGKDLGKVASLKKDGNQSEFYIDIGGFLGIGATRTLISSDQIQEVKDDRIVLRLTEAEAKKLPAADDSKPAAQ
jgi:sporulation protein YlmC with PRC-barrel domain